jgi:HMG-box domain
VPSPLAPQWFDLLLISFAFLLQPTRPRHGYNFYFQWERARMVEAREVAGFGNMAKTISAKWKTLERTDPALFQKCQEMKRQDTIRYKRELATWLALKDATATAQENAKTSVGREDTRSEETPDFYKDPMAVLPVGGELIHSSECSWNLRDILGFDLSDDTPSQPDLAKVYDSDSDDDVSFDYDEPIPDA